MDLRWLDSPPLGHTKMLLGFNLSIIEILLAKHSYSWVTLPHKGYLLREKDE